MYNSVNLCGILGNDPDIKEIKSSINNNNSSNNTPRKIALLTVGSYTMVPSSGTPTGLGAAKMESVMQWHSILVNSSKFITQVIEPFFKKGLILQVTGYLAYRQYTITDAKGKVHYARRPQIIVSQYSGSIRIITTPPAISLGTEEYMLKLNKDDPNNTIVFYPQEEISDAPINIHN